MSKVPAFAQNFTAEASANPPPAPPRPALLPFLALHDHAFLQSLPLARLILRCRLILCWRLIRILCLVGLL